MKYSFLTIIFVLFTSISNAATTRWTPEAAQKWSQSQGWRVGSNYTPMTAINQLEMWQKDTFDAALIDRELGYAEKMGMNTMRVFLHDLLWDEDANGFSERIEKFLEIAERHGIRPLFVLFDSCWDPKPRLGKQRDPVPGVHNSGWMQSPGVDALLDASHKPRLEAYVKGIIGRFANDQRILGWDLWNEPDGINSGYYGDPETKLNAVEELLPQVFEWARTVNPIQPLTSAVWAGDWSSDEKLRPIEKIQLHLSDIITFHNYDEAAIFEVRIQWLKRFDRPIFCTEYLARVLNNNIQTILPLLKKYNVGAFNWGFVSGKTQTIYPWDSWLQPYPAPPAVWFHDLLYPDGTPFNQDEVDIFKQVINGATLAPYAIRRASI